MTSEEILTQYGPREAMEYDVVVVGAGPAGLATAIRLKQLAAADGKEVSVVVLEKGSEPGAHILSGAIMDPGALTELLPDWKALGAPLNQPVTSDRFLFLTETGAKATPDFLLPDCFKNHGNYIISLGNVVRWMAQQAEALGVEIFPGFPGRRGALQRRRLGQGRRHRQPRHRQGRRADLRTSSSAWSCMRSTPSSPEGSRGSLGKQLIARFKLDDGKDPQSYGIGLKELWEIDPAKHEPGLVVHTAGWPLDPATYGGSFLYHLDNHQVELGFVVGLDYTNPWLSPFEELQRWKTHPEIRKYLEGGKRLGYGAARSPRAASSACRRPCFPGGALVGCEAGYLNASRIKGSHAAIKTGMLAAEAAHRRARRGRQHDELAAVPAGVRVELAACRARPGAQLQAMVQEGAHDRDADDRHRAMAAARLGMKAPPWTLHRTQPITCT
jgi:electron-transferring-flavoprotein dehydrogenase